MQHPELGDIRVVGLPMQFSRHPRAEIALQAAPAQGAHTDSILQELGYAPERIAQLRERFVV
jgi:crotonobetainyl-CoA:carnitine CoA-transferase CaiB-like acyl-CoA transferase